MNFANSDIKSKLLMLKEKFTDCPDLVVRQVNFKNGLLGIFLFIEGLIDLNLFQRDLLNPILSIDYENLRNPNYIRTLPIAKLSTLTDLNSVIKDITQGRVIFIVEGIDYIISCGITKFEKRNISEPESEKNVRGAHEGFVESSATNISILRRKIRNNDLKFKSFQLGTATNQDIYIAYINKIANPEILNELINRINKINFDGFLGSGYVEQMISDSPSSPFPQFIASERPDKVVAQLLEGRLAVIVDGTPVVIVAPVSFFSFFQAQDDYNGSWYLGTFLRILRVIAILLALFLPAIYIAITSFHYYLIPLRLLIPLAESRDRVPFPPYFEAVIMEFTIELLREASVRLPTYIGTSIGVIGGIIIGQAAVQAGIVSVLMIIVVAVTAIASYVTPLYDMGFSLRFIRFIAMLASSLYGIIGILVCLVLLVGHLLSLESLGQPYFQPLYPLKIKDIKDTFFRAPFKYQKNRPDIAQPLDKKRGFNDEK